jgi:DNA-binding LacI/PurR family transcriptional regulator
MPQAETVRGSSVGESVYETLRCRIETMRPGQRLATGRELAGQYGVSYSTVRRVTARLQEEGHVEKVQGRGTFVAQREEQQPEEGTVSIIYADPWKVQGNPFFIRCLQGVVDETHRCGYRLQVFRCPHLSSGQEEFQRLKEDVAREEVRGLLLPWVNQHLAEELRGVSPDLRMVSMSTRYPPEGVSSVLLDFAALGRRAGQQMLARGVRRLVAVSAQSEMPVGLERALNLDSGEGKVDPHRFDCPPNEPQDTASLAAEILSLEPEGIIFDDDRLGERCLDQLLGQEPDLLSHCHMISHANEGEDLFPPEVDRLVMDSHEIGTGAIRLLRRMIEENRSHEITLLVQPRLELSKEVVDG